MIIGVIGDRKRVDLPALEQLGTVIELRPEQQLAILTARPPP